MRLWVKRGFNGTPSSISLGTDDLIDDVKDAVFRKYPVALARLYDSPDVSICLVEPSSSKPNTIETRVLAVDEQISKVVQTHFPAGQRIEDALVIQVPPTQSRRSPYVGPVRNSNSPLSGTLGLMTDNMQDFEYFPETPPIAGDSHGSGSGNDYVASSRSTFVPSNYSSGSHSLQGYSSQPIPGIESSFRPAPNLNMSSSRYIRDQRTNGRPGMGNRTATNASSNNSIGGYTRSDGAITFYPKQVRSHRASSSTSHSAHNSPRQQAQAVRIEEGGSTTMPQSMASLSTADDRSMSPSVVPLSEQELSASGHSRQVSVSIAPNGTIPENHDSATSPASPQSAKARRETVSQGQRAGNLQRPGLTRTLTASKLSMVSPAVSPHASSNSVAQLEKKALASQPKEDVLAGQQSTFGVGGLLEGVVPPIVVLIVEDNMINQRILETFMKKRKIRCLTAKNGREAVDKWKKGGVHLVLMDIQMPVMSGIEATKEIRRLERTNSIGVFSKKEVIGCAVDPADVLTDLHFRSPVIIVALTASSLQSDRHEALAAGCNDFLTKPVSLVWLEKKVLEWGCMQALIDFEGWRKFRGLQEPSK